MATGWSTAELCWLLVLSVLGSVPASDQVPVLVWTNDPSISFPQQFVGHSISHQEFQESYVKGSSSYNEDNIVWFIQDRLKAADFALFSDAFSSSDEMNSFRHMESLMSEMTSAYLPSVSSPASIPVEEETLNLRKAMTVYDPREIKLESDDGPHMIIVKLPELSYSPKSFSEIDELIDTVSLQLKTSDRPFIAFYTANHSSQDAANLLSHRQGRQLMATEKKRSSEIFLNYSDTFYLYTKNFTISLNRSSSSITHLEVDENRTKCEHTGSLCHVTLMLSEVSRMAMYNASVRFELDAKEYGFWYLSNFSLEYWNVVNSSDESNRQTIELAGDFVEATPVGFSYHCSKLPAMTVRTQTGSSKVVPVITFSHFQIQAFFAERGQFGHYNDCVGFFTPGIWMSIITSFILIAILSFGIIMMLNISTQDRFGDVHGNTLTITVSDG